MALLLFGGPRGSPWQGHICLRRLAQRHRHVETPKSTKVNVSFAPVVSCAFTVLQEQFLMAPLTAYGEFVMWLLPWTPPRPAFHQT